MKKQFVVFVSLVLFSLTGFAQDGSLNLPIMLKNADGSNDMYEIQKGDKLVYHVKAGAVEYDFIITVNSSEGALDFNYEMTNAKKTSGHVTIGADARDTATRYVNYFSGGELNLTDAITVWLSRTNFRNMSDKKTIMTLDEGAP